MAELNATATMSNVLSATAVLSQVVQSGGSAATGDATVDQVLAGATFSNADDIDLTGTMPNIGKEDFTPTTTNQTISAGYHDGTGIIDGDADLIAENIKKDVDIFGVVGTLEAGTAATGTATVGQVLSGATFSNETAAGLTGTMPNRGAVNVTPGTSAQTIAEGYHSGAGSVAGDADLVAGNIKAGANIFGVAGNVIQSTGDAAAANVLTGKTFSNASASGVSGTMPNIGAQNITPSASNQSISTGYHNGSGVVAGDADLVTGNIKAGVTIFGVAGKTEVVDTSSGDAVAANILNGKKAWVDGVEVTGNIPTQTLSATSTTVSAGYYAATTLEAVDTDLTAANIKKDVVIFGITGSYEGTSASPFNFRSSDKTIYMGGYNVEVGGRACTIPDSIGGVAVENIHNYAFDRIGSSNVIHGGSTITSLVLPSGLKKIGSYAFRYNNITGNVTIPSTVTYIDATNGGYNFYGNKIQSVTFPATALFTTIPAYCFSTNSIAGKLTVTSGITTLGTQAFSYNAITELELAASVSSTGLYCFFSSAITKITIGSNVTIATDGSNPNFGNYGVAFEALYNGNGKLAGTYEYAAGTWTKTA